MSKIYEIDPEADTLVVVHPLAESFAPWPEHDNKSTTIPTQHLTNGYRNGAVVPVPAPAGVRIKVSSKHLSLASPRFRDILAQKTAAAANTNGSGKQSNGVTTPPASPNSLWRKQAATTTATDESDGRIHIVLDGLDADATTTVLNIVHGRGGKDRVPKTVSLEALARIAVVVDKLKLQDAVEIYADRWVDELHSKSAPSSKDSSRDLVFWIYVAYVFQRDRIFKEATKIAAAQLTGPLPTLPNLPLRAKIAHDIDTQRQAVIGQALDILETAVDKLVQGDLDQDEETTATDGEDNNSDTFLLGTLLRTLHRHKLIWPRPPSPYAGVSIAAISHVAHDVQTRAWRTAFRIGDSTRNNRTNNQLLLTPQLDNLRAGVVGLALKSDLGYNLY
ncbi:hypothetical protein HMPREF1624_07763 [Sporothrix schenckii ATCC 58251]|uniref:BTB domain-containing protein n=1 Tax=Sporothrix schenckii (strain ATCC 58251 / de Perez 2211183) TaxID=1391915 RepID=U7PJ67_SPOS1|nr:hypothetical protein HMPREF1624_07763 [Sporothrix schenckii ATCC 58251]